jgi:hypothetical protein
MGINYGIAPGYQAYVSHRQYQQPLLREWDSNEMTMGYSLSASQAARGIFICFCGRLAWLIMNIQLSSHCYPILAAMAADIADVIHMLGTQVLSRN